MRVFEVEHPAIWRMTPRSLRLDTSFTRDLAVALDFARQQVRDLLDRSRGRLGAPLIEKLFHVRRLQDFFHRGVQRLDAILRRTRGRENAPPQLVFVTRQPRL